MMIFEVGHFTSLYRKRTHQSTAIKKIQLFFIHIFYCNSTWNKNKYEFQITKSGKMLKVF